MKIEFEVGDKVREVDLEIVKPRYGVMTIDRIGGMFYPCGILCITDRGPVWFHAEDLEKVK